MTRYIGLDAHSSSCTFGVISERGKRLKHQTVETNGTVPIEFVKTVPKTRYLCVEEGTQSQWLYDLLSRHVEEMIVVQPNKTKGNKDDIRDAYKLAEDMRIGAATPIIIFSIRFGSRDEATSEGSCIRGTEATCYQQSIEELLRHGRYPSGSTMTTIE